MSQTTPKNLICSRCGCTTPANPLNTTLQAGERIKLRCTVCRKNTTHEIK